MRTSNSICHFVSFHSPINCFQIHNHWFIHRYMERTSFGEDCMCMRFAILLFISQMIYLHRLESNQVFTMDNETRILQSLCSQLQRTQNELIIPSVSLSVDYLSLQIFTITDSTKLLQNEFARSWT